MFNSSILDVAIGLAFAYLLLALICTTANEWISGVFKTRGKMLRQGISCLLADQPLDTGDFWAEFQKHPLIARLSQDKGSLPSYMAPRTFALAVIDLVTKQKPGVIDFNDLQAGINNLRPGQVKNALLAVIQNTKNLPEAQAQIEGWFNDSMDRVSGWFTRRKQWMTVLLAAGVTVFCNADTLAIANKLWINPVLREDVVNRAKANQSDIKARFPVTYEDTNPKPSRPRVERRDPNLQHIQQIHSQLEDLMGWVADWHQAGENVGALAVLGFYHVPGWILTIVAVSMGAPFWFDMLNRFMNLRSAGKSPAEGAKGPRKDTSEEP